MRIYILGLLNRFGEWLVAKVESKVWRCYFCKKYFSGHKPRVNAYVAGMPILQCETCRLRHQKDPRRKDTPPEGVFK